MTEVSDAPRTGWAALPVWARVGMLALAAIVLALIALVLIRVATKVPPIPLGPTPASELRPGSCLEEKATDRDEYTVVPCDEEHAQQVFAVADLELDDSIYSLVDTSLALFGEEVCDRYLEYRLFLVADLDRGDFETHVLAAPTPEQYAEGLTEARCAITADDASTLTRDLYRPMP